MLEAPSLTLTFGVEFQVFDQRLNRCDAALYLLTLRDGNRERTCFGRGPIRAEKDELRALRIGSIRLGTANRGAMAL